jgi:hypothetical protein
MKRRVRLPASRRLAAHQSGGAIAESFEESPSGVKYVIAVLTAGGQDQIPDTWLKRGLNGNPNVF